MGTAAVVTAHTQGLSLILALLSFCSTLLAGLFSDDEAEDLPALMRALHSVPGGGSSAVGDTVSLGTRTPPTNPAAMSQLLSAGGREAAIMVRTLCQAGTSTSCQRLGAGGDDGHFGYPLHLQITPCMSREEKPPLSFLAGWMAASKPLL